MKPKRILSILLTALLILSLTACGNGSEKDEDSVKVPESIKIESSVTYEEAIADLKYDQKVCDIFKWAENNCYDLTMLCYHDIGGSYSWTNNNGVLVTNFVRDEVTGEDKPDEEAVTKCLNRLEIEFMAEPEYTKYMATAANATIRDAYIKFIDYAKDMQQKYSQTRPTFEDKTMSIDASQDRLWEYFSRLSDYNMYATKDMEAEDYFRLNLLNIYTPLLYIEQHCVYTQEWFFDQMSSDEPSGQYERFTTLSLYGIFEDLDVDFELSQLEIAMSQKNNLNAIANKYFGNDEIAIKAYDDFMKEVNRLYEIVRLHRPENGTGYSQKYDYNLDRLAELKDKLGLSLHI